MKRRLAVTVIGRENRWAFEFDGDPKYLDEWRADGLEVVEIYNSIPEWVVGAGMLRPWCFVQDLFNFRNPFKA